MKGLYDIHCHIVPQVDDGAASVEEALKMLKLEYMEGVRTIIATPHYRMGMFETPTERVRRHFAYLKRAALKERCGIELHLGCEFHVNMDMINQLKNGIGNTMAGSRYVLAEFSRNDNKNYIQERIHSLLSNGYKPIIAHVERYSSMRKDISFIQDMVDMGACIQINAGSIIGENGFSTKHFCRKLIKSRMLHFVGTDAHGAKRRPPKLREAYSYIAEMMGDKYADTVFIKNPQRMLK